MIKKIHLKGLGMQGRGSDGLPLEALTQLLVNPLRECYLEELKVEKCRFSSDEWEEENLSRALRGLFGLQSLEWEEGEPPSSFEVTHRHSSPLRSGGVVKTILNLPALRDLSLRASPCHAPSSSATSVLDSVALGKFARSSMCHSLTLKHIQMDHSSISALIQALEHPNCTLHTLILDLSQAIELDVNELFQAFQTNQSVTNLELWISHQRTWKENQCLLMLACAVRRNRHIASLRLRSHPSSSCHQRRRFSDEDAYEFCKVLETANHSLTHVELDDYDNGSNYHDQGKFAQAIDFYTKLNFCGRKEIRETMLTFDMSKWVGLLSVHDHAYSMSAITEEESMQNVEAVYFWLHRNPSIISTSSYQNATSSKEIGAVSAEC